MSDMLNKLVGESCSLLNEDGEYLTGSADIACDVIDVDGEWIKIAFTDHKGRRITRLSRVEALCGITVYEK